MTKEIDFHIKHIDPLGQGVSKTGDKVTFINKTLPEEKGLAQVYRETSKVRFARLTEIKQASEHRISPDCLHFENCPGCHFLHTSYSKELEFKKLSMQRLFRNWEMDIQVHSTEQRLGYRNRIQLHYDTNLKKLGFIDRETKSIVEVPKCMIGLEPIRDELNKLYANQAWLQFALSSNKKKGHVELYYRDEKVHLTWNQPYASGGFSQVHGKMNHKLIELVDQNLVGQPQIWDLFGGSGNLSANLSDNQAWVVDNISPQKIQLKDHQRFEQINLFSEDALDQLERLAPFSPETFILDPPRSGFKQLGALLKRTPVKKLLYISCNPDSMLRDIKGIEELKLPYRLEALHLLDLFPGTYHYEAMALISAV